MRVENKPIFPFFLSGCRIVEKKRYDKLNDAAYSALKYRVCAANFFINRCRLPLVDCYDDAVVRFARSVFIDTVAYIIDGCRLIYFDEWQPVLFCYPTEFDEQ